MDASIPDEASQLPVSSVDTAGLTLGSGGLQVIGDDPDEGNVSQPPDPDIIFPDDNPWDPDVDSPPSTPPFTGAPPGLPTLAPEPLSEGIIPYTVTQVYFSWTETPSAPTSLTEPTPIFFTINPPLASNPMSYDTILSRSAESVMPSTILPSGTLTSTLWISSTVSSSALKLTYASISGSVFTSIPSVSKSVSSLSSTASIPTFSSSVSSPSISVSSTISQHLPSETVIAPPLPANLNVHPPTFYVGIGLGSLVAVALLVALIAWWIRRQTRRRRRDQTMVPWGRSDDYDDDGALESGRNTSEIDAVALAAHNLGSREDLAHIQAWSSHGDRDVGEPKRAPTYSNAPMHGLYPYAHSGQARRVDNPMGYGYHYAENPRGPAPRHLPLHLIADEIPSGAYQRDRTLYEHARQCDHPKNSPDAFSSGIKHTYDGSRTKAHWDHEPPSEVPLTPPRSMANRLRNLGRPPSDLPEKGPERLPTPTGPTLGTEEFEQWSTSLKTSLVNAFNAVASNLGSRAPHLKEDDSLTAAPRRSIRRPQRTGSDGEKMGRKDISRRDSVSTTVSKPWTLEETSGGAGIVHLHLPELDKHGISPQRPTMHGPTLSFGDGENISIFNDEKAGLQDLKSQEHQIALFASSKPKRAFIRPEAYFARQKSAETVNSIYSTLSAPRSLTQPQRCASRLSRTPSVTGNLHPTGSLRDCEEVESVVIAPETISRLSSCDSSLAMLSAQGSLLGPRSPADAAASRALKERQKRVVEAQSAHALFK